MQRLDPASLRAALWAWRAARSAHRQLQAGEALRLPRVPRLPARAVRGVDFVITRYGHRCLVQAHVRQAWFLAHGNPRDVVIGVRSDPEFTAHAWLDGDPPEKQQGCRELTRRPPS